MAKNYVEAVYWSRYDADNSYRWYIKRQHHDKHPVLFRAKYGTKRVLSLIRMLRWPKPSLEDWRDKDFLKVLNGWQSFKSELEFQKSNPFRNKWQRIRHEHLSKPTLHGW